MPAPGQGPHFGPGGPGGHGPAAHFDGKRPTVADLFAQLDKNKDGKLTKDEVPPRLWEHLTKAGAVKNGAVTKEALESSLKKMREEFQKKQAEQKAKQPK
jgi:hypothetical protein